jgi:DNA gyrase subunit B
MTDGPRSSRDEHEIVAHMQQIRSRPIFLGNLADGSAILELVKRVASHAIALDIRGDCSRLDVRLLEDGSIQIEDDGPGIPFEQPEPSDDVWGESYRALRGQHRGVRESNDILSRQNPTEDLRAPCALAAWMEIEIRRGRIQFYQRFEVGRCVTELTPLAPIDSSGTTITFLPDATILSRIKPSWNRLFAWLRAQSALSRGLSITLFDEAADESIQFHHPEGLASYLNDRAGGLSFVEGSRDAFHIHRDGEMYFEIDVAICWRLVDHGEVHSIVNGNPEVVSGTHLMGLDEAIGEAIEAVAPGAGHENAGARTPGWRRGLFAVVALWLRNTQLTGREGTHLGTFEAREIVRATLVHGLIDYLRARPALVESLTPRWG